MYIQRVNSNPIATRVKTNDLQHNSDLSRLTSPNKVDLARKKKYEQAVEELLSEQFEYHLQTFKKFPPMKFKAGQKVRFKDKKNITGFIFVADFGGAGGFDFHTYDIDTNGMLYKHVPEEQLEEVEEKEDTTIDMQTIVDAINAYQDKVGQESGFQQDQLRYTEIVESGENIISVETRAHSNETKEIEFSIITENGKIVSINQV